MKKKSFIRLLLACLPLGLGCVDQVKLSVPTAELPFIVEGTVTDQDGADTIKITKAFPVDGNFYSRVGVTGAKLVISDDAGHRDVLTDISLGYYVTDSIVGTIGRTYTLRGTIPGGIQIESTAERMASAGVIDTIFYEFTSKIASNGVNENGFNVYVNSTLDPGSSSRMRWKFDGTYRLTTDPSQIQIPDPNCVGPECTPITLPCAADCSCCVCFAYERESAPLVSDTRTTGSAIINRTFIRYIPINSLTFNDRYRVEVTQMEVSQSVYDFYFDLKRQIANASSLFQPPFFELKGNVALVAGQTKVIGIFSAAAQVRKHIYINKSDVPYSMGTETIVGDCRSVVPHSTTTVPPFWD